jgi:hypothetical protein
MTQLHRSLHTCNKSAAKEKKDHTHLLQNHTTEEKRELLALLQPVRKKKEGIMKICVVGEGYGIGVSVMMLWLLCCSVAAPTLALSPFLFSPPQKSTEAGRFVTQDVKWFSQRLDHFNPLVCMYVFLCVYVCVCLLFHLFLCFFFVVEFLQLSMIVNGVVVWLMVKSSRRSSLDFCY